ncbi:hypothetical protein [Microcoleus sp. MON2_D5]|uniref:hypothetical protein n=1 Tax=Microcoleus sp. MON2_D5 TaxID=2818833 RepID=UPI002FD773C3
MTQSTMKQILINESQKLYRFKLEALKQHKEKMNEFWLGRIQQAQLLGVTKSQMAQLRSIYVDDIEKIEFEITETQAALDSEI